MKRILIVGSGDVAKRAVSRLRERFEVFALIRRLDAASEWRSLGAVPILGDLDVRSSLHRIAGLAQIVLHCAPPKDTGSDDLRTRNLIAALCEGYALPRQFIYVSTTGVYGDCHGEIVSETRPVQPTTTRAVRRVAAELRLRAFAIQSGINLTVLRAPGIYAANRLSLARLERRDPVLLPEEDVITNHIHADDLAQVAVKAIFSGKGIRTYNVCDDSWLPMGDYYDAMADMFSLPRPPRLSYEACGRQLTPATLSFMSESRRLSNLRMKKELRVRLQFPHVIEGLRAARDVLSKSET